MPHFIKEFRNDPPFDILISLSIWISICLAFRMKNVVNSASHTPPPPPVTAIRFLECLSALRKLESSKLHASDTLAANGLHAKQVSPTAHIRVRFAGAVLMLLADKAVETLVFPQQCFNVQCLDPSVLRRGGDRGVVSSQIRLRDCGQLGSLGCPGLFQPF